MSEAAGTMTKKAGRLFNRRITIQFLKDSKWVFGVIFKGPRTSDKHIMLDNAAAREQFRVLDIPEIELVHDVKNRTNKLTKFM